MIPRVCLVCLLIATQIVAQKELFVPANDVAFAISTERNNYGVREQITVEYRIANVSNGPLYVPRGFETTVCLNLGPPHIRGGFENSAGQHFYPGFGASCSNTPGVAPPTLTARMRQGAVLLRPGEHLKGTLHLDPAMFRLSPGTYRIEAVLDGWKDEEFSDAERMELDKMGSPFLRGEVPASAGITLMAARR